METKLKPEAKKRLERYHQALLQEDGTVEHELATLIHAFLNGHFGEPYLPIREEEQHRIAEGDRHYDVLTTAISSYLFRHDYDMEDKDFVALEEASDALAFYTYQNEANPRKAISAFFARFHKKPAGTEDKSSNPKTSLADILADIQTIIQRYQQAGVSEKLIRKALKRARKELEGKEQIHHGRETAESRSKETSGAIQ